MFEGDPSCLATATVNRMLRPLRTRCNALAKIVSVQSRAPHTYSSSRTPLLQSTNHDLPLVVHPPPDKFSSKAHFLQDYKDNLELIRRIYAVRDAFRNVVARTSLGQPSQRTPALSSLCAIVIGQNMPGWEEPPESEDVCSESDATGFVDQMYEALPMQSRGWLLSSHALAIILNTCPHHLTLVTILLDEALAHRLEHHVSQLLEALLLIALRPKPNGPPAICHPAHAKFLTECLDKWLSAEFSPAAFTKVLIQVMSDVQSSEVWTSKAIESVIRRLYHLDLSAFICFVVELASHIASKAQLRRHSQSNPQIPNDILVLSRQFSQLCNVLLERFSLSPQDPSHYLPFNDQLYNLITTTGISQVSGAGDETLVLRDSIISLALVWFTHHRHAAPSLYLEIIEATLASFTPRPATFQALVSHVFSTRSLDDGKLWLKPYISTLQKYSFPRLEASFWGSTLYVVENLEGDSRLTVDGRIAVRAYRQEVMTHVGEAESKLYPVPNRKAPNFEFKHKALLSVSQSPWSKGGWKWEPLMECWVRQQAPESYSPSAAIARKKRRTALVTPNKRAGRDLQRSSPYGSWTRTPTKFQYENIRRLPSLKVSPPTTLSVNFTSLAANAVSQRTVLHRVSLNGNRRSSVDRISSDRTTELAFANSRQHTKEKKRRAYEVHHQPSDDILDLLAGHSSPSQYDSDDVISALQTDREQKAEYSKTLMSSKKAKDIKALPLSDTLRDLALLRASDVDLGALLPSGAKSDGSGIDDEGSLAESSEFIREARKALKVQNRGDGETQGKKLDDVRRRFEDLLDGLEQREEPVPGA